MTKEVEAARDGKLWLRVQPMHRDDKLIVRWRVGHDEYGELGSGYQNNDFMAVAEGSRQFNILLDGVRSRA